MYINYTDINKSKLYKEILNHSPNLELDEFVIPIEREEKGYEGKYDVEIIQNQNIFYVADYRNKDQTRFPARLKVIATLLKNYNKFGWYNFESKNNNLIAKKIKKTTTWKEDVIRALYNLNGKAHLSEIFKEVKKLRKGNLNPTWERTVQRELESNSSDSEAYLGKDDLFYSVQGKGRGFWGIRENKTLKKRIVWERDEYILILSLYLKYREKAPAKNSEELKKYSDLLRKLNPNHSNDDFKYRNLNGVYMRLMNFRACDPYWIDQGKVGMDAGNKGKCKEIWDEFYGNEEEVKILANEIEEEILTNNSLTEENLNNTETVFKREGKKKLRIHYGRERKSQRVKKLAEFIRENGKIYCEACRKDYLEYKDVSEIKSIFEVHHNVPLSESDKEVETKLSDLSVLCANCHRAIHSKNPYLDINKLVQGLNK